MATTTSQYMRFISKPARKARTLAPMQVTILIGWLATLPLFLVASRAMQQDMLSAAILLVMGSGLGYHMAVVTLEVVHDSHSTFDLLLDKNFITLTTFDKGKQASEIRQLPLEDISLGEYYSMKDSASLVLYGAQTQLEIPLWSFGPEAEPQIINHILSKGIPIEHLPRTA